jgi:hypothetical protein
MQQPEQSRCPSYRGLLQLARGAFCDSYSRRVLRFVVV